MLGSTGGAVRVSVAILLWLALEAASGSAATFVVNNNGDGSDATPGNGVCATSGGACTLRAAVQEANASAGPDTITIPAMTIVLGSTLVVDQPGVAAPLTISGAGPGQTILDGNNAVRVLEYRVASGPHTLANLTIRKASSTGNGGAVLNVTTLTVSNVAFENNSARQGGALFNETAGPVYVPDLTLVGVTFTGNQSTTAVFGEGGGALFNGAKLTASFATFTGNSSQQGGAFYNNSFHPAVVTDFTMSGNSAKYGGGVDNDLGSVTLRRGVISGNVASCCGVGGSTDYTGGGGVYHNEGTLVVEDVAFVDNRATSAGGYGGGLYSFQTATLTRVSFVANRAAYGAGIYAGNSSGVAATLGLTNVTLSGNVGTSSASPFIQAVGAGLYVANNCQVTVTNSTVTANSAVAAGGIERAPSATSSTVTLRNTVLGGNTDTLGSPNCRGTLASGGHNVLQSLAGCTLPTTTGDQVGVDPRLLALVGRPSHHPLRLDSPALQGGSNGVCPSTDGRGQVRPQLGLCDVGAFERGDAAGLGDLDGNGRADVLWREAGGTTYLWSMNGAQVASAGFTSGQADASWQLLRLADFSGDGRADVLWRNRTTGQTVVWTMQGTNVASAAFTTSGAGLAWRVEAAADFDGDGRADILWREPTSGATYVWFMNGATVASAGFTTSTAGPAWQAVAVADFTGDGKADILWRETASGLTYLWVMSGTTVSAGSGFTSGSADPGWLVEGAGDMNGDGRADLLWRSRASGGSVVWTMNGASVDAVAFTSASAGLDWDPVGVADLTGDGKADVLWRESSGGTTYLWAMSGATVSAGTGFTSGQAGNAWQARHPR